VAAGFSKIFEKNVRPAELVAVVVIFVSLPLAGNQSVRICERVD
jgi:hypothetical protein